MRTDYLDYDMQIHFPETLCIICCRAHGADRSFLDGMLFFAESECTHPGFVFKSPPLTLSDAGDAQRLRSLELVSLGERIGKHGVQSF